MKTIKNIKMYYNTTNETGATLENNKSKANNQDIKILNIFRANKGTKLTWCDVHAMANLKCPESSTKRALNTLMNDCKIIKCDDKKMSKYGRMVYTWKLA